MMKKRRLLFNGLLGVFAFITMIISLITLNTSVSNFGVADFTPYAITLSKDKNKIETSLSTKDTLSTSVTTELGNDLEVYSELVSNNPYGWQTFMDNGLFEIKEAVHGITKLEMDRAVQSNLTIYYSIDGTRWEEKVIEDTDDTFISETFADYLPNYLKITFNTQTMITSAKIEYTCT